MGRDVPSLMPNPTAVAIQEEWARLMVIHHQWCIELLGPLA